MEERTTQSSLAEKMNQLYAEREEQYRRREKLFDERAAQLQSLSDSLEKKKNALDEKNNALNVLICYNKKSGYPCLRKQKGETDMTLNQIIYFQKVARLENYHLAAKELYVSQPSLSRSMAALESELGVALFEKKGRGVTLTKAGKLFLEHADRIAGDCDIAVGKMQELSSDGGKIDIGYIFPLAGHYIPHKVRKFLNQEENKNVVFNFWQNHTPAIAEKVRTGELDVGFGGYLKMDDMEFFPLSAQELVIITPKEHPLSEMQEVPLVELDYYPVIGYESASWMGTYAKYLYRKYQVNPNTIVECPDEYSIVSLVRENFGIALMPQTDILLNADGINIHKIMGLEIYRQVFMFWMKDRYRLPAVERFIEYMKTQQAEDANDTENVSKIYLKDIVNF